MKNKMCFEKLVEVICIQEGRNENATVHAFDEDAKIALNSDADVREDAE